MKISKEEGKSLRTLKVSAESLLNQIEKLLEDVNIGEEAGEGDHHPIREGTSDNAGRKVMIETMAKKRKAGRA